VINKIAYFFVLMLLLIIKTSAQKNSIDSLNLLLKNETESNRKVDLLNELAYKLNYDNVDLAFSKSQEALKLAQKLNYKKGEISARIRISAVYLTKGDIENSVATSIENRKMAEDLGDLDALGKIYIHFGVLNAKILNNKTGITFTILAIDYFKKTKNVTLEITGLLNLGSFYMEINKLDSAKYYMDIAFEKSKHVKKFNERGLLMNMGLVNYKLGNNQKALGYYFEAIPEMLKENENSFLAESYYEIGLIYEAKNQIDSSIYFAQKALPYFQGNVNLDFKTNTHFLLARLYEKTNKNLSYEYYKKATILKNNLLKSENLRDIYNMNFIEKLHYKELETTKQAYQSKLKIIGLAALLVIISLFSLFLFRNNNEKKRTNALLNQQNADIENQKKQLESSLDNLRITQNQLIQKEKLASLGELTAGIAHEIQNPLNFVNNFSDLSSELLEELKAEITTSTNKTNNNQKLSLINDLLANVEKINQHGNRASSIVKNMLEHSRTSTGIPTEIDINILAEEYLKLSYLGMRAKNINFSADYVFDKQAELPKIKVVAQDIARVLLNLLNNAFYEVNKRSMLQDQTEFKPIVRLKTKLDIDKNQIFITVEDNGMGINEATKQKIFQPFFTTKPAGEGTGLGLSLSNEIITKGHNGELLVESEVGIGTKFIIKLPIIVA
jgi:two-component system, NtrC family, sensor kinase